MKLPESVHQNLKSLLGATAWDDGLLLYLAWERKRMRDLLEREDMEGKEADFIRGEIRLIKKLTKLRQDLPRIVKGR